MLLTKLYICNTDHPYLKLCFYNENCQFKSTTISEVVNMQMVDKFPEILRNLPDDACLDCCWTEDQREHFNKMRKHNCLIADFWIATLNKTDIQFWQSLKNMSYDDVFVEYLDMEIARYKLLHEIVKMGECYAREFHESLPHYFSVFDLILSPKKSDFMKSLFTSIVKEKYNFSTSDDLFEQIIREEQTLLFQDCTYPFIEFSKGQYTKIIKVILIIIVNLEKILKNQITEISVRRKVDSFVKYARTNSLKYSWLEMTLFSCHFMAIVNRDYQLQSKIDEYYTLVGQKMLKLCLKVFRKRASKTWKKTYSFRWLNGKKILIIPKKNA